MVIKLILSENKQIAKDIYSITKCINLGKMQTNAIYCLKIRMQWEFSCGTAGQGSGTVTTVAWVAAVARVLPLGGELQHAKGEAKKKKTQTNICSRNIKTGIET